MKAFKRYAVYVMPPGRLYDMASRWLGWDARRGAVCVPPDLARLPGFTDDLTAQPRRYGFHGTIKPPFWLAEGESVAALEGQLATLCSRLGPVTLDRLEVSTLGGFVALTPTAPSAALNALAARMVEGVDRFRAPPPAAELARRRQSRLSERQEEMLSRWGYPYVMEEFRFHMTLSGRLPAGHATDLAKELSAYFGSELREPFVIDQLALVGEAADGRFHLLADYALGSEPGPV